MRKLSAVIVVIGAIAGALFDMANITGGSVVLAIYLLWQSRMEEKARIVERVCS